MNRSMRYISSAKRVQKFNLLREKESGLQIRVVSNRDLIQDSPHDAIIKSSETDLESQFLDQVLQWLPKSG